MGWPFYLALLAAIASTAVAIAGTLVAGLLWRSGRNQSHELDNLRDEKQQRDQQLALKEQETSRQTSEIEQHRAEEQKLHEQLDDSRVALARAQERLSGQEDLEKRFKEFTEANLQRGQKHLLSAGKASYEEALKPFRDEVKEFKKKFEDLSQKSGEGMANLNGVVGQMMQRTNLVGEQAENLANALRTSPQQRGAWGEQGLKRLLEASGLEEGVHYQLQESYTHEDEHGRHLRRPDAVLLLGEKRHVVIDAKVSLNPWVDLNEALEKRGSEEEEQRETISQLRRDFRVALERHVKDLQSKEYQTVVPGHTYEVCLMYVPLEPAWIYLQKEFPDLVSAAQRANIAIVSAATLMPILRLVEFLWRQQQQMDNVAEILRRAEAMGNKLYTFVRHMDKVGKQLDGAQRAHTDAAKSLRDGKGNLLNQVSKIRELGVKSFESSEKMLEAGAHYDTGREDDLLASDSEDK